MEDFRSRALQVMLNLLASHWADEGTTTLACSVSTANLAWLMNAVQRVGGVFSCEVCWSWSGRSLTTRGETDHHTPPHATRAMNGLN